MSGCREAPLLGPASPAAVLPLARIDVSLIEQAHLELLKQLMRNKSLGHEHPHNRLHQRWGERRQDFQWVNAMKSYHFLMRLAHLVNTLARFSKELAGLFAQLGVQAAIGLMRNTLTGPWLDPVQIEQRLSRPFRLR